MKKILLIILFLFCSKVYASIVLMDADSSRVLYEKNMNERKLIASTTKIMTSIIALENAKLNDKIKIGKEIDKMYGSMTYIKQGEIFTLNDLLYGLMLQSGNDCAMSISSNVLQYDDFIAQMNIKAYKLGMYNTSFENPHGLNDDSNNYSTAYDMALLMKYAIKNRDFIKITSTNKYKINGYIWYNKNELLNDYKYTISGKIGYTKKSGPVFVSAARKDNKTLIIVSINEEDKFILHKKLYERYFKEYNKVRILDKSIFSYRIKDNNYNRYYINNNFDMLLKDNEIDRIKVKVNISDYFSCVKVYLGNSLIHKEKLYKISYINRKKSLIDLLPF